MEKLKVPVKIRAHTQESSDNSLNCGNNKVELDNYEMGELSGVTASNENLSMSDNDSDDVSSALAQLQSTWNGINKLPVGKWYAV